MAMMDKFKGHQAAGEPQVTPNSSHDIETQANTDAITSDNKQAAADLSDYQTKEELPTEDAQAGVQQIEAVTLAWTKRSLAALLCFIWLLFLTNGMRLSILASLLPYVTSDFKSHSLMTTIEIVSSAMAAATYIPVAKMLDVWGRAEGFAVLVVFSTIGLILMAVSQNLATFCAAQIFYSVGFSGLIYVVCVLAADSTNLRNRGLAFAFTSSPYMITAFAGSKAAEGFLKHVNWRWGFGCFAIILPIVTMPLFLILKLNLRKAVKRGLYEKKSSGRTIPQKIWWFIVQFDLPGVFLLAGGITMFLLPFTLAYSAPQGWKTPYIIGMIVTGFVMLVIFGLHQAYLAPAPFMKHNFLTDRTVIAACLIDLTYQMSYSCWANYFTSFLQVVSNISVSEAGYINSTFSIVSGVLLFFVGYLIRRTGRFKWLFFWAVPLYVFSLGLMIYFRKPNTKVGFLIMCEVFISIGGAVFILCMQLAVLAAVDHQHVAAALAILFVAGTIGSAIGSAISGAIWTNTFAGALGRYLPESALPNLMTIYADLPTQLSYPVGSPERLGIQQAYGYAQTRMLAAGTGIMCLSFIWMFMLRNLKVSQMSQTKGVVF
ncbi:probable transporter (major facilitator superfamily) [Rhynchosporium agropyri]|uniref:Probable transporter (Major facilitator superfamily) n=1 Tax=Rhynchosporium agropyri TaxID=914238 RepID=A0A1E1LM28_9HELO|nr:probable transporter (major facilitator superfamily) [Rhynchosporium agropyri]